MSRKERKWHPNFAKYMETIVNHPNYKSMPSPRKADGSIMWVVIGNGSIGRARIDWWGKKSGKLGIKKVGKWISKVARANHPFGEKPCQICGKYMKLGYVYPTTNCLRRLNSVIKSGITFSRFQKIQDIIDMILTVSKDHALDKLQEIFDISDSIARTKESYLKFILDERKSFLSPGAMSNAPDRFDGYHSYNLCCRSEQDTGRHKDNLARYGEDRRAYENWSDGDWKAASWLMKRINKESDQSICAICGKKVRITADHIGPISLGFSHMPRFQPACKACNSAKNNSMFFKDVRSLMNYEKQGVQVVSWHSRYIWDALKNKVKNDSDARKLSKLMRANLHYVLLSLAKIRTAGFSKFLVGNFLHPEYAFYSIYFKPIDPSNCTYKVLKIKGDKKQYKNNARRYIRISLDSLDLYDKWLRRKLGRLPPHLEKMINDVVGDLRKKDEKAAMYKLDKFLRNLSETLAKKY